MGIRLLAIGLTAGALATLLQGLVLGGGSLLAQFRGTWDPTPADRGGEALIGQQHFWRDQLSLGARGVLLAVLAAVLAAAVTTLLRHTGGLLGLLAGWFIIIEPLVQVFGGRWGLGRWLLSQNVVAFLMPGGLSMSTGVRRTAEGEQPITVLVSNLDALLYVAGITAVAAVAAAVVLRRRDL
jgi:hypothetical protein